MNDINNNTNNNPGNNYNDYESYRPDYSRKSGDYLGTGSEPGGRDYSYDISITNSLRTGRRVRNAVIIILVIALIFGVSAASYHYAINYKIDSISVAAEKSDDSSRAKGAGKAHEVDISDSLREYTADYVYEQEAMPSYTYDEIWNMDVSKPSGVTADDLKLVTRQGLVGLEDAFVKAEEDYGVNCLFVMAIASLESANGTMCFRKNNMFGFGSSGFSSKEECIDVVSRALAYNYLAPGGSLYNGTRITDVNKRYAASSTWDSKVCRNMTNYYSVITPNHNAQLEKLK